MSKKNMENYSNDNLDRQPTMRDLIQLLSDKASKADIDDIKSQIVEYQLDHHNKFEIMENKMYDVETTVNNNSDRVSALESTIEQLKQDKLRNNICISGMPTNWDGNTVKLLLNIANKININITSADFKSYTTPNGKFVIVSFYNYLHKQSLLNKMRTKRSLMFEEVYTAVKSNNQLYINEHLTPYYSSLFKVARQAIKDGKLVSATSYNGRIRIRKHKDDSPTIVNNIDQLNAIIEFNIEADSNIYNIDDNPRSQSKKDNGFLSNNNSNYCHNEVNNSEKKKKKKNSRRVRNNNSPNNQSFSRK